MNKLINANLMAGHSTDHAWKVSHFSSKCKPIGMTTGNTRSITEPLYTKLKTTL